MDEHIKPRRKRKKSKSEYRAEEITGKETDNRIETMKESLEDIEV